MKSVGNCYDCQAVPSLHLQSDLQLKDSIHAIAIVNLQSGNQMVGETGCVSLLGAHRARKHTRMHTALAKKPVKPAKMQPN